MTDTDQKEPADCHFVRDSATWMAYVLGAAGNFLPASLGPAMPFLKAEWQMNYKVAAMHFSAWACGSLIAGLIGERIFRRLGRMTAAWLATALCLPAIALFAFAHHPAASISAIVCMGFFCSIALQAIVSMLADRFGAQRVGFIQEINAISSFAGGVAPLVVSACARFGLGWRACYLLPASGMFYFLIALKSKPAAFHKHSQAGACSGALPASYWGYWSLIGIAVACEWSLIFWSADFMENIGKLARTDAAASVAIFQLAMVAGRFAGGRFAGGAKINTLLIFSCLLAICGFPIFWLGPSAAVMMTGLFITGLGISNIYPLSYSAAMGTMPGRTALAAARMSIASSLAVLSAPAILGCIADNSSIFTAYGVVGLLLVACLLVAFIASRLSAQGIVPEIIEADGATLRRR
jgi:MFS family permease